MLKPNWNKTMMTEFAYDGRKLLFNSFSCFCWCHAILCRNSNEQNNHTFWYILLIIFTYHSPCCLPIDVVCPLNQKDPISCLVSPCFATFMGHEYDITTRDNYRTKRPKKLLLDNKLTNFIVELTTTYHHQVPILAKPREDGQKSGPHHHHNPQYCHRGLGWTARAGKV